MLNKSKKINNVVFYTDENGVRVATVFYKDGTTDKVSFDEGIEACEEFAKDLGIKTKSEFDELINSKYFYILTLDDFKKRYDEFVGDKEDTLSNTMELNTKEINEALEESEKNNKDDNAEIEDEEEDDYDIIPIDTDIEDDDAIELEEEPSLFRKVANKLRESKVFGKVVAFATTIALAIGLSGSTRLVRNSKTGNITKSTMTALDDSKNSKDKDVDTIVVSENNKYYDSYSYDKLLSVTKSEVQKSAMTNLGTTIKGFNGDFANGHIEAGKNIRAGLKFDEVVALQVAYNDYSKKDLKAIFNGADIESKTLANAYKDASLQLMGAYVIETNDSRVDMSGLLVDEDAKAYYNKVHQMFIDANNASGQDKLNKIKIFYDEIRQDFPITSNVREEGIAHADSRSSLESYKLSVAPMVAAGEMMWQNLDVDLTLDDKSINFLNDIGLCNYAEDKFERVETITLTTDEDTENPTYDQYRGAVEEMLKENGYEVTDDAHRELSNLEAFQIKVNGHFEKSASTSYSSNYVAHGAATSKSTTSTKTTSKTTYSHSHKETAVSESEVPRDVVEKVHNEVNTQLEKENAASKAEAEKKADEVQKEMQSEENKKGEEIKEQIDKEDKQLQDNIDKANEQINENNKDNDTSNDKPVNEKDLGENVDIDDKYTDDKGNINDSVKDITTDSTGDQTDEALPDPNETGKEFDARTDTGEAATEVVDDNPEVIDEGEDEKETEKTPEPTVAPTKEATATPKATPEATATPVSTPEAPVASTPSATEATVVETPQASEETYASYDDPSLYDVVDEGVTNEEAVDAYVESLDGGNTNEDGYQYTK